MKWHRLGLWSIAAVAVVGVAITLCLHFKQTNDSPNKAVTTGELIVDDAPRRELAADRLVARVVDELKADSPKRGALHIAKLRHGGDWNVAPLAIPNLMDALRKPPLNFDVVISQQELFPTDPSLSVHPLAYIHGRTALRFKKEDMEHLRRHLEPGGGTIFSDAACGSAVFDKAFRRFVAELLPNNPMIPIPHDDDLYSDRIGVDLSKAQYSKAAGGGQDFPLLEGVKLNGRWSIIYSKYDIGFALERRNDIDCKGYDHESALKIAENIVIYSTLP